jgi:hypothetical protein
MEKMFELARKFRLAVMVIGIGAIIISNSASAFWPPDWVPHPIVPDDTGVKKPSDPL